MAQILSKTSLRNLQTVYSVQAKSNPPNITGKTCLRQKEVLLKLKSMRKLSYKLLLRKKKNQNSILSFPQQVTIYQERQPNENQQFCLF